VATRELRQNEVEVSVVVPAYNAPHCLAETIRSVLAQQIVSDLLLLDSNSVATAA
jgi:glycosyltransferase involved in cell wall biosynthesis